MTVFDYLIDHSDFNWPTLLSGWGWLLADEEFSVWLMNRFGDLFLIFDDGTVRMLDCGAGTLEKVAESKDDFCDRVDEGDNADDWLMIPLVDQLVEAGTTLTKGPCYSFRVPPVLGGAYSIENTVTLDIAGHYSLYGEVHEQLKDLPDGTEVRLRVI